MKYSVRYNGLLSNLNGSRNAEYLKIDKWKITMALDDDYNDVFL